VLGDGGDATPFCVSMTSKAYSMFKLNDNEFPLVVIGITDVVYICSVNGLYHCVVINKFIYFINRCHQLIKQSRLLINYVINYLFHK
jgi:hypothetical protein